MAFGDKFTASQRHNFCMYCRFVYWLVTIIVTTSCMDYHAFRHNNVPDVVFSAFFITSRILLTYSLYRGVLHTITDHLHLYPWMMLCEVLMLPAAIYQIFAADHPDRIAVSYMVFLLLQFFATCAYVCLALIPSSHVPQPSLRAWLPIVPAMVAASLTVALPAYRAGTLIIQLVPDNRFIHNAILVLVSMFVAMTETACFNACAIIAQLPLGIYLIAHYANSSLHVSWGYHYLTLNLLAGVAGAFLLVKRPQARQARGQALLEKLEEDEGSAVKEQIVSENSSANVETL